jgi:hypothetical protein
MSPVKYELGLYIPEEDILHSHRRENLRSYIINRIISLLRVLYPTHTNLCSCSANGTRRPVCTAKMGGGMFDGTPPAWRGGEGGRGEVSLLFS